MKPAQETDRTFGLAFGGKKPAPSDAEPRLEKQCRGELGGHKPETACALLVRELPFQAPALVRVPELGDYEVTQEKRRRLSLPETIPQPTYEEAKTLAMAYADGPGGYRWESISGEVALRHGVPGRSMEAKLTAGESMDLRDAPATIGDLRRELAETGIDSLFVLFAVLHLAATTQGYVTVAIDELSQATWGRPRSKAARLERRRIVYRWLCLFENTRVIGDRARGKYRDRLTGKPLITISSEPLFRLGRKVYEVNGAPELDASEPPLEVTVHAMPWLDNLRGNRQVLADFGNIRQLAEIPSGRPSGAWARSIGFALNQLWREMASYATVAHRGDENTLTVRFPHPFTRRKLLGTFPPRRHSVETVLNSSNPGRARTYWDEAIMLLKRAGIVGHCKPMGPPLKARKNWQDEWLDEPLDIRPKEPGVKAVAAIARAAKRGKRERNKGRKHNSTGEK